MKYIPTRLLVSRCTGMNLLLHRHFPQGIPNAATPKELYQKKMYCYMHSQVLHAVFEQSVRRFDYIERCHMRGASVRMACLAKISSRSVWRVT